MKGITPPPARRYPHASRTPRLLHRHWLGLPLLLIALFGLGTLGTSASGIPTTHQPYRPAPNSPALVGPNVTASMTYALVVDGGRSGIADPGDTLEYTVTINDTGADATGVTFTDTAGTNTTYVANSAKASPVAVNDTYPQTVIGNVSIDSSLIPFSITSNDFIGIPAATITAFDATSAQGGQVTMTASGANIGQFTYNPPPGYEGVDSFTYTLSNSVGSSTGTVSLTVSGMVWFINNNAASCTTLAAGCGRLSNPFSTLAAFQALNNGTGNNPAANDNIFIYESSTTYGGPVTLLSGQKLIGQDSNSSLATLTGLTPPSGSAAFPVMNTGAPATTISAAGNGVNLNGAGASNSLNGFTLGTCNSCLNGTSFGTLSVGDVIVNTTGEALSLSMGSLSTPANYSGFTSITATGGTNGVFLSSINGTANLGGGALSASTGDEFSVNSGTADITYSGTINNTAARSVSIASKAGGTVTLSGAVSGTGTGVNLTSNSGATINFTGGINLSTGGNTAFNATGGGTVNATQNNTSIVNTLATTTGTALNVANTTIGASGLTFRSISSNGAANGISLVNTTGSFTVVGNGGSCDAGTPTCTGGRIQNTTGADFNSPAPPNTNEPGVGVYMNNAQSVSLTRMHLNDHSNFAVYGTNVTGFTMDTSLIDGTNGTNVTTPINDGSVSFFGLFGTSSFTNSTIKGGRQRNVNITNSSGTADLTISGSTIRDTSTLTGGDDNLFIQADTTATITAHVTGNTFKNSYGDHFQSNALNSISMTVVFTGNFYSAADPAWAPLVLGGGVTIGGGNAGSTEHVNFNISNNGSSGSPLIGSIQGGAINVNQGSGGGTWQGQVSGNWIGDPATPNSGSTQSSGIRVENHSVSGTMKAIVGGPTAADGNHVRQWNSGAGINFQIGDTGNVNAAIDLTVMNNVVSNPGASSQHGIVGNFGADAAGTNAVCDDTKTNNVDLGATPPNGGANIRLRQRNSSTVKLPGYVGKTDGTDNAPGTGVIGFESSQNTLNPAGNVTFSASGSGGGFIGGGACAQPTVPTGLLLPQNNQGVTQNQIETNPIDHAQGSNTLLTSANAFDFPFGFANLFQQAAFISPNDSTVTVTAKNPQPKSIPNLGSSGGSGPPPQLAPALAPKVADVNISIGTLPTGKSVVIKFRVTINNPWGGGNSVQNQGTVSGSNFANVLTDDPSVGGTSDPTVTPVPAPTDIYVDDNFPNPTPGQDPDGGGPATNFGFDSFASIQSGINAVPSGGIVHVADGSYTETVTMNQSALVVLSGTVTLNGDLTLSNGTWTSTSGTFNLSGNFTHSGGAFTHNSGTVVFNGTGAQTLGGTTTTTFDHLTAANTSAALSVNTNTTVNGALTVNSGTTLAPGVSVVIGGGGTLTGSGTIMVSRTAATADLDSQYTIATKTLTNLTANYGGNGVQTINAYTYGALVTSGLGTKTLGGNVAVNGAVTINSGTVLAAGANALGVGGNWTNNVGASGFTSSGTVTFNGNNNTQTLSGSNTFNNLTINHSGSGGVTASGSTLSVQGLLDVQSGSFTSASSYNDVQIDNAGTLAAPSGTPTLTINGNWTDNHTSGSGFTPGTSTLVFAKSGTAALSLPNQTGGVETLCNLTVNGGTVLDTGDDAVSLSGVGCGAYTNSGQLTRSETKTVNASTTFSDSTNIATLALSNLSPAFGATTLTTAAGAAFPNPTCANPPLNPVKRSWTLTESGGSGTTATADFSFRDSEVPNGVLVNTLQIYKCSNPPSGVWVLVGKTSSYSYPPGPATGYSSVQADGVPFGSSFLLAPSSPTAVELSEFTAQRPSLNPRLAVGLGVAALGLLVWWRRRK